MTLVDFFIPWPRKWTCHWECENAPEEKKYDVYLHFDVNWEFRYHDPLISQASSKTSRKLTDTKKSGTRKIKVSPWTMWCWIFTKWHKEKRFYLIRRVVRAAWVNGGAISPTLSNIGKAIASLQRFPVSSAKDLSLTVFEFLQAAQSNLCLNIAKHCWPNPITVNFKPDESWACGPELRLRVFARKGFKDANKQFSYLTSNTTTYIICVTKVICNVYK